MEDKKDSSTDMAQWEKENTAFLIKIGQIERAQTTKKDEA